MEVISSRIGQLPGYSILITGHSSFTLKNKISLKKLLASTQ